MTATTAAGRAQAGDGRFFASAGPFTLAQVVEAAGAGVTLPPGSAGTIITGVAPLGSAVPGEVSFLANRHYAPALRSTKASAVITLPAFNADVPAGCLGLPTNQPYLAWARVARLFHPEKAPSGTIHPTAVVAPSAKLGAGCTIGPLAVVEEEVVLGPGCVVEAHAHIAAHVVMGAGCRIGSGASLSHALLGDKVRVFPGARIGQDGFGFTPGPDGFEDVPQLGRVILEDGVQVGANTTIDRGSARDTVIGAGTRIDNLVQIGHNVQTGRGCVIVAQAGVSGSTTLEDHVTLAAQAGLVGHITIGKGARVGAQCGVMDDVPPGADVIGSPAMPFWEFFRNVAFLRRLARKPRHSS
ncbi:UDP-3-O-(3-hydroxymyristoyl)glucosamine N-acyltransferase [Formicincola oecophyllae]|uniref:UDP-3-O-acylglucosamine N-acyltransferase n=1 Tax=Formicincola oecophyllae TaxID=2558361 RepID=A0A4Y6UBP5_9PROT|nr:UDP-3-O-(3-hydroxymyristoyl)glucosamine N-acyltransferase [Formicincola oecophyllae]QDH13887.1 UDP-3-O-(3-hydroxymyristoyl)glucosamine N-acyltransferase [Formicincola oecophyllae]